MIPPRLVSEGASGDISRSMRSRISVQGLSCAAIRCKTSSSDDWQQSRIGSMAARATRSCTVSRGVMRPTATLEMRRSRSPIRHSWRSMSSLASGWRKKNSTTSCRSRIGPVSFRGKVIQRFNNRAPIGHTVRSMMSSRLFPPSFIVESSSRLRTVNLSRRT